MVENFRVSWFEENNENEKLVKVPYSGGYSKNFDIVFNLAFNSHEIKTVYYGLDMFLNFFSRDSNATRNELPQYLYDYNVFNDVKYIYNKDVWYKYTLYNIKNLVENVKTDNDLAYVWNDKCTYGLDEILKTYSRPQIVQKAVDKSLYMPNYDKNMQNITKYIKQHPETKFKIFLPPYSILEWDKVVRNGQFDMQIEITKRVMEDLLQYENVELYYFQNIEEIITNFDNYKDYSHYNEKINYYMFECMCKNGNNRITKNNYINEINHMYEIVKNYDFDKIFNE